MRRTNFDRYLERQLQDPEFAARFKHAGEGWDVALQIAAMRERAGLSQKELARLLKTSQQQISRLESPNYEGHSLTMLRRVAHVLNARVRVVFEANPEKVALHVAEPSQPYRVKQRLRKQRRMRIAALEQATDRRYRRLKASKKLKMTTAGELRKMLEKCRMG
jgi:transcriptional regulator with XRE-family HTH domain